ncbi:MULTISPECIES: hypothetical protein [unclassified Pseudomonas]|uniref:hypothetical protein n=1 Tax=unclassified Pseudomonas TaxID=196821 RepID=UPI0011BED35F|nr:MULTISPECIES: hypothetical protein [unclassified Pseudomonas]
MPQNLTKQDLQTLDILLTYDSVSTMYAVLQQKGYRYAVLAENVVSQSSASGAAAVGFLKATAEHEGVAVSSDTLNFIYTKMARGYLDALNAQFNSQGVVNRDINHREAWDFHSKAFGAYGLSADAWTLNSVFTVVANDVMRERYWSEILASAGDPIAEAVILVKTENLMATASVIGNSQIKAIAQGWRARVDTPTMTAAVLNGTAGMVADRLSGLFRDISNTVLGPIPPETVIPVWVPAPTPTPSSTPNSTAAPSPIPPPPRPPAPPVRKPPKRRPNLPPPTTHQGHPGSGYGPTVWGNTGPRFRLDP